MDKRIVVGTTTYRETLRILNSYLNRYGDITISELINKFDHDTLILN